MSWLLTGILLLSIVVDGRVARHHLSLSNRKLDGLSHMTNRIWNVVVRIRGLVGGVVPAGGPTGQGACLAGQTKGGEGEFVNVPSGPERLHGLIGPSQASCKKKIS